MSVNIQVSAIYRGRVEIQELNSIFCLYRIARFIVAGRDKLPRCGVPIIGIAVDGEYTQILINVLVKIFIRGVYPGNISAGR